MKTDLLGKFKKKKEPAEGKKDIDAAFDKVMTEIRRIDDWENPQRLQHYILDSCEQIIATTKTVGRYKTEVMKERILDINPSPTNHRFRIALIFIPEIHFHTADKDYRSRNIGKHG